VAVDAGIVFGQLTGKSIAFGAQLRTGFWHIAQYDQQLVDRKDEVRGVVE
jgi:hypothetical protein